MLVNKCSYSFSITCWFPFVKVSSGFPPSVYTLLYIYVFTPPRFLYHPFPQHTTGHIYGCKVTNKFPKYVLNVCGWLSMVTRTDKYKNDTGVAMNKNLPVCSYHACFQLLRGKRCGGIYYPAARLTPDSGTNPRAVNRLMLWRLLCIAGENAEGMTLTCDTCHSVVLHFISKEGRWQADWTNAQICLPWGTPDYKEY